MPYNLYYAYETVKKHLYNSENWTENQVDAFNMMYGFNLLGWYPWQGTIDAIYDSRNGDLYRKRYGISGGGFDPRRAPDANIGGSISGTLTSDLNFVSRNVGRLYKDDKPKKHRIGRELDDYVKYQMWRHGY